MKRVFLLGGNIACYSRTDSRVSACIGKDPELIAKVETGGNYHGIRDSGGGISGLSSRG